MTISELYPLRQLDYSGMRAWCRRFPVKIDSSHSLHCDLDGFYNWKNDTIYIDRNLMYDVKRCVLVHELVHWEYDDHDSSHELRCRQDTAMILIDPIEYENAEQMYDNTFEIAQYLGVIPRIVSDWQQSMHDNPLLALHNI